MTAYERIARLEKIVSNLKKRICCIQTGSLGGVPLIESTDFEPDGVTYINENLTGKTYEIFLNELNRFLYNEPGNQEWDYIPGGGFEILLPGFDANSNTYHLYILPKP